MTYKPLFCLVAIIVFISCKKGGNVVAQDFEANKKKLVYQVSKIGDTLDVFNKVCVFYNESMNNTSGRNLTKDGYNLGLKWQCVEFVKRYYFKQLNHKMPNTYGHAKDFYNTKLRDGQVNRDRNLIQYSNGSKLKPKVDDLIVFKGNMFNPYGHVAIVSKIEDLEMEIIQQNVGKTSRETFTLKLKDNLWYVNDSAALGWLRME